MVVLVWWYYFEHVPALVTYFEINLTTVCIVTIQESCLACLFFKLSLAGVSRASRAVMKPHNVGLQNLTFVIDAAGVAQHISPPVCIIVDRRIIRMLTVLFFHLCVLLNANDLFKLTGCSCPDEAGIIPFYFDRP